MECACVRACATRASDDLHFQFGGKDSLRENLNTALTDLKTAILLDSSDAETHKWKGICLQDMGSNDNALDSFDEAIRLAPIDSDAYHKRGGYYLLARDWVKADADFTHAIELDPKLVKALVARGIVRQQIGDSIGALADLDAAIRLDDTDTTAYITRSFIHLKTGDLEKAVADCTRAIDLSPIESQVQSAYVNRGCAYLKLDELSKALTDCSKAMADSNLKRNTRGPVDRSGWGPGPFCRARGSVGGCVV